MHQDDNNQPAEELERFLRLVDSESGDEYQEAQHGHDSEDVHEIAAARDRGDPVEEGRQLVDVEVGVYGEGRHDSSCYLPAAAKRRLPARLDGRFAIRLRSM